MDLVNFLNITPLSDNSVIISGYRRDQDTGFSNASTYLLKLGTDQNDLALDPSFGIAGKLRDNLCDYDDVYNSLAIDEQQNMFATGYWWRSFVIGAPVVKYNQNGVRTAFDTSDPNGANAVYVDNYNHLGVGNRSGYIYPLSSPSIKYDEKSHCLIYASLVDTRDPATDNILIFSINSQTGIPNKSFGTSFNLTNDPSVPDRYGVSVRDTTSLNLHTSTGRYPGQPGFSTTSLIEIQEKQASDNRVVAITTAAFGSEYDPVAIGYKLSDGQLDTSFGDNGLCRINLPVNASSILYDTFSSSACDEFGNIFISGVCNSPIFNQGKNFYVAKIGLNGELDTSFNETGISYIDIGWENKSMIAVDKIGNVIVATTSYGIGGNLHLTRINPDGKLDTTFGTEGSLFVTIPTATGGDPNDVVISDVKVLPNGNYVTAFQTGVASVLVLYDSSGIILSSYVEGGYVDNDVIGTSSADYVVANEGDDHIDSGDGNDNLDGGAGNDYLYGGNGNDSVYCGSGDDVIIGGDGAGDDTYYGGIGSDTVKYNSAKWGITVDLSKDNGSAASLAKEKIKDAAGIGKDKLFEIENVIAGDYDDTIKGSKLANILKGEGGNDTIFAADGNDYLYGGAGTDKLDGGLGDDTMAGGAGDDIYEVDSLNDTVTESLNEGSDTIRTSLTSYTLTADNVENLTYTGSLAATLTGNSLANRIIGGIGNDVLSGGTGDDILSGQAGSDKLNGDDGSDTVDYTGIATALNITLSSGAATVIVSKTETDTLTSIENLIGGSGADSLIGDTKDNALKGGLGNDLLKGGAGNDSYYIQLGKSGNDIIIDSSGTGDSFYIAGTSQGYILDFDVSTDNKQLLLNISLDKKVVQTTTFKEDDNSAIVGWDIENLVLIDSGTMLSLVSATLDVAGKITATGTSSNEVLLGLSKDDSLSGGDGIDYLFGGRGNDKLWGGSGDDYIHAGAGDDFITGGTGADLLIGGLGADRFIYSSAADGSDRIMGFTSTDGDSIRLNNGVGGFTAITKSLITSSGFLDISAFVAGNKATAKDANDRIVFDTGTSKLYYDADGSGSGVSILLATLIGVTSLKATDIWVGDLSAT